MYMYIIRKCAEEVLFGVACVARPKLREREKKIASKREKISFDKFENEMMLIKCAYTRTLSNGIYHSRR